MRIFGTEVEKVSGAGKFVALHTVKVCRGAQMQPVPLRLDGFGGQSHVSARSDPKERAAGTQRLQSQTGNHHIHIFKKAVIFHCLHIATKSFHFKDSSKKYKNVFNVNEKVVQVHSKIYVELVMISEGGDTGT
jgi:hypothetical protein